MGIRKHKSLKKGLTLNGAYIKTRCLGNHKQTQNEVVMVGSRQYSIRKTNYGVIRKCHIYQRLEYSSWCSLSQPYKCERVIIITLQKSDVKVKEKQFPHRLRIRRRFKDKASACLNERNANKSRCKLHFVESDSI